MSRLSNTSPSSSRQNSIETSVPMSLERRLELLEPRFTQPGITTKSASNSGFGNNANLSRSARSTNGTNSNPATTTTANNSQHSFSFGSPESSPATSNLPPSPIPPSAVRSRRRPSTSASMHAVSMAAARHMRKVAAGSPIQGFSGNSGANSNTSSPGQNSCSSSNQTMLTSHVQHNQQRVVAESPPVVISPANTATTCTGTPKPTAARSLYSSDDQDMSDTKSNGSTSTSGNTSTKRKSNPKRKKSSIKDNSVQGITPDSKKVKTEPEQPQYQVSPRTPMPPAYSENSRDRSNPSRSSTSSNKSKARPANNKSIHDFFSAATTNSNKKKDVEDTADDTTENDTATIPAVRTRTAPQAISTPTVDWQAKCIRLERELQDKEEQLKAVTNNKTILHTALQTALEKTKKELVQQKEANAKYQEKTSEVLEELLRWKAMQQAKELRETLATDGARLGRIVYARAGMRAVESWEEGYATRDLENRKRELKKTRQALEARLENILATADNMSKLEAVEAKQSVKMHLENVRVKEQELAEEEQALNDEKGAHIRALKTVASEDASRFRSRPKLHDRYILSSLLGKGGFSEVWRGYDLQELREVAVKIHQLDPRWPESKKENYTKHVSREYEIHRNVRHPRIVSLYDVFEIDNNSFATVLECCKGTDLDTLLKSEKRLPERRARAILLQILSGMNYLSQPGGKRQGIIHYDLKPGNILFDEFGDAKITDFGLSKIVDTPDPAESMELTSQGAGTYWYLPPECFITGERVRISNKVDVWSIGVVYYQMLFGVRPFGEGKSQDKLLTEHTMLNAHEVHFPDSPEISDAGKEFIRQCLQYDQAFRPTIAQLCENSYLFNTEL